MGCFAKVAANPETDPLIEVICASLNSIGKRLDRLMVQKAEADLVPVSGSADPNSHLHYFTTLRTCSGTVRGTNSV
jgi:hypothetical protein